MNELIALRDRTPPQRGEYLVYGLSDDRPTFTIALWDSTLRPGAFFSDVEDAGYAFTATHWAELPPRPMNEV